MKTVLITGVAGLLGSRLAGWIIDNKPDYKIVGIDNLSGGYLEFVPGEVKFIQADLISAELDVILATYDIDYVFHFAAYAAEGLSPFIRRYNYECNLIATANIVNYCINNDIKRLVFTSSMAVYGVGNPPFDESDPPRPVDPYGIAKYCCEMDIQVANQQHGLEYCIIRPHNVYGINQNIWDRYRNVLGIWMLQKLNGEKLTIFGEGFQKRAFSYVDDCLSPLWNAAESELGRNEIINLGGMSEISIADAASIFSEIVGGITVDHLEPRHEVLNAYSTFQKSIDLLDYKDQTSLREGLRTMWDWAQTLPKRERSKWKKYEIETGLYDYWKN